MKINLALRVSVSAAALALSVASAQAQAVDYDAEFNAQWGLRMIGIDQEMAAKWNGKGVRVGITDTGLNTGIDPSIGLHEEFAGRYTGLGWDGFNNEALRYDGDPRVGIFESHGTHVAGIIAANRDGVGMHGVASGSTIVPLRNIAGPTGVDDNVVLRRVLRYGLANDVRIFNASWGSDSGYDFQFDDDTGERGPLTRDFIIENAGSYADIFQEVVDADGVMVFANGNFGDYSIPEDGPEGFPLSIDAALPYYFPGLEKGWLAVASVGPNGTSASYSQSCSVGMMWCLTAPGGAFNQVDDPDGLEDGGIISTYPTGLTPEAGYSYSDDGNYVSYQGTSMAAPHVSGALAIAKQLYPNARYQDLRNLVLHTTVDIGELGIDPVYGWGMLNVRNIVDTMSDEAGDIYAQQPWARQGVINHVIDTLNPNSSPEHNGDWGYWLQPLGVFGTLDAGSSADFNAAGLSAGVEGGIAPDWYAKVFGAFTNSSISGDGNSARDLGLHLGSQVVYESPSWFADGTLGASLFSSDVTRTSAPGIVGGVLDGATLGTSSSTDFAQWAALRFGYHFEVGEAGTVSPYVFGRLAHQSLSGFDETGAAVAVSGGSNTILSGEFGLGMKWIGPGFTSGPLEITPVLDVAYSRQGGDYRRGFELLGNGMTASTGDIGPDTLQIGVATEITSTQSPFDLKLGYSAQLQSGATTHAVSLKLMGQF